MTLKQILISLWAISSLSLIVSTITFLKVFS